MADSEPKRISRRARGEETVSDVTKDFEVYALRHNLVATRKRAQKVWMAAYEAGEIAMKEKAAKECEVLHKIHPRSSRREPNCAGVIRALPLSGAEEAKK